MMLFSERLALSKEFEAWASQNKVKDNPLGVISYLCIRGLLISPKEKALTAAEKRDKQTDRIVDLIYQLLNEYDIGVWRDIEYTELADLWVSLIDQGVLEEKALKARIKEFLLTGGVSNG